MNMISVISLLDPAVRSILGTTITHRQIPDTSDQRGGTVAVVTDITTTAHGTLDAVSWVARPWHRIDLGDIPFDAHRTAVDPASLIDPYGWRDALIAHAIATWQRTPHPTPGLAWNEPTWATHGHPDRGDWTVVNLAEIVARITTNTVIDHDGVVWLTASSPLICHGRVPIGRRCQTCGNHVADRTAEVALGRIDPALDLTEDDEETLRDAIDRREDDMQDALVAMLADDIGRAERVDLDRTAAAIRGAIAEIGGALDHRVFDPDDLDSIAEVLAPLDRAMRRRPPLAQIIDTRVTWHAEDGVLHGRIVIASVHGHHDATVAVTVI